MHIAIIGAGNVGRALGARFSETGHKVTYGVRDVSDAKHADLPSRAAPGDAAREAEVIILATPWPATEAAVASLGELGDRILVDATNPLTADLSGLTLGHADSAGEQVARWARGGRVVKAFNTTGAANMHQPVRDGRRSVMFVAGDDAAARGRIRELAHAIGFDAYEFGPLARARILEPFALAWISLAYAEGLGPEFLFSLVRDS
ncbi:MAG: NAD(P)-binding domain-containing protein [Pseudomonadota bacterium]